MRNGDKQYKIPTFSVDRRCGLINQKVFHYQNNHRALLKPNDYSCPNIHFSIKRCLEAKGRLRTVSQYNFIDLQMNGRRMGILIEGVLSVSYNN
jgi:hypothetical protein